MKTDRLIHALAQDLPTRPADVRHRLWQLLPIASGIVIVGWLTVMGWRPDVLSTGLYPTALKLVLGLLLMLVGLVGAVRLSRPEATVFASIGWVAVVVTTAVLASSAELFVLGLEGWQSRLLGKGIASCLTIIPLLAMAPLAVALVALRNGATSRPRTTATLAGFGAAGIAIIPFGLFCPENSALFIGAWYVLASMICGALGALAGRVALRW